MSVASTMVHPSSSKIYSRTSQSAGRSSDEGGIISLWRRCRAGAFTQIVVPNGAASKMVFICFLRREE